MQKHFLLFFALLPLLPLSAQTNDLPTYGYNYQAIIRDGSGNVAANAPVQLQFQIPNSADNISYETHDTLTTDSFGHLISVVGKGAGAYGEALIVRLLVRA